MDFILLLLIGSALYFTVKTYNRLQRLSQGVKETQSNMAEKLRRKVEITNKLQELVKSYADHEVLHNLRISDDHRLMIAQTEEAMVQLQSLAFAYPEIKANENYQHLMEQASALDGELVDSRMEYNRCVSDYNSERNAIPGSFIAGIFGFQEAMYFSEENMDKIRAFEAPDAEMVRDVIKRTGQGVVQQGVQLTNKAKEVGRNWKEEETSVRETVSEADEEK